MISPSTKPLRKDAVRNRALLIEAAIEVFAERGLDATLDDVAHHAGVGVGTAYRHFANKQELASEALSGAIEQLARDAEYALTVTDPWQAFAGFFETVAERQRLNRGLHHLLAHEGIVSDAVRQRLAAAVTQLFERAIKAGAIRSDAAPTDIGPILAMLRTVTDMSIGSSPDLWRRYLTFLLDGFRATDRPVTSVPALTLQEFDTAMATKNKGSYT